MSSSPPPLTSTAAATGRLTGLKAQQMLNNAQAITNRAFVSPGTFEELARNAGLDPVAVKDRGVLCAIGNAVLYIK